MSQSHQKCFKDLKIVLVGNSGTGKTSFATRWINGTFSETYKATIMSDFSYKIYTYKGKTYKIQIWDIAGQDKNIYTSKIFTKNAHASITLSDVTIPNSLKETLKWKKAVDENTKFMDNEAIPAVLIQNKIDLIEESKLRNDEEIKQFAKDNGFVNYFKTSCKDGTGINECMDFLIQNIVDRMEEYAKSTNIPLVTDDRSSVVIEKTKSFMSRRDNANSNTKYCCSYI
ncbi:MAG: GTP-binding protein [archaeon]|nr:GTP-binding protein [archaeon]